MGLGAVRCNSKQDNPQLVKALIAGLTVASMRSLFAPTRMPGFSSVCNMQNQWAACKGDAARRCLQAEQTRILYLRALSKP